MTTLRAVPSSHLLERVEEIPLTDGVLHAARGQQRRLVDEVGEVGARHAGRRRRETLEIDVRGRAEPCGYGPCRISTRPFWSGACTTICRSNLPGRSSAGSRMSGRLVAAMTITPSLPGEAVHLGENLVQGLLALVVAAHRQRPGPRAADRVDLVDEDDRRRHLPRLREQLAHAAGADADDHLDELGRAGAEEGDLGLARRGARQQRLARARGPGKQHALGRARAEAAVLRGVLQEVHDLVDLRLHFVDAGDVRERRADALGIDPLLLARLPAGRRPAAPSGA